MTEALILAAAFRTLLRLLGIGVLVVAVLAWFISWLRDKIA
jgi:hypothetical protein